MDYRVIRQGELEIERYEFDTAAQLEDFFIAEIIGQDNLASKVIGNVLLVWRKAR